MKKFYCQECELNFDKTMNLIGKRRTEVCPRCMNKDFRRADGYGTEEYWRTAYWQLKEKHNKILRILEN